MKCLLGSRCKSCKRGGPGWSGRAFEQMWFSGRQVPKSIEIGQQVFM